MVACYIYNTINNFIGLKHHSVSRPEIQSQWRYDKPTGDTSLCPLEDPLSSA